MKTHTLAAFIFVFALLFAAAGCNDRGREANIGPEERRDTITVSNTNTVNTTVPAANTGNVTIADIVRDMNTYTGRTVVVNGWVERSYGENTFRLDEDSTFTGGIDNDLLVVGAKGVIPAGLKFGSADARVRVTGTVKRFVIAEIEPDYGIDLTSEVEAEFKDKPVLVANSVQTLERDE